MVNLHKQALVPLGELRGAEYNPRTMPAAEMERLKASLRSFGFVTPVAAREEDMLLLGGHQRVAAMREILRADGQDDAAIDAFAVPTVLVADITDEQAKALNVALNKISGEWDYDKLSDLLGSIAETEHVELTGFNKSEVDDIIALSSVGMPSAAPEETMTDEEVQNVVEAQQLRMSVAFASGADRDTTMAALKRFGMTGPKDLAAALVRMASASAVLPAFEAPAKKQRAKKDKAKA